MFRSLGRTLRYIILAALLLVVTLCALEVGLRCRRALSPELSLPEQSDLGHPLAIPSATTFIELRPGQERHMPHPDTGELTLLRTNSLGLRGPQYAIPKPPGVLRILCLGDELTLADGLPEEAAYPARLESLLASRGTHRVEVINAGLPLGCPLLALLHLKQRLLVVQPDLVILHFDMTDVADDHRIRPWVSQDREFGVRHAMHPLLSPGTRQEWQRWEEEFLIARWGLGGVWEKWSLASGGGSRFDINTRLGGEAWIRDDPPDWNVYIRHALAPVREMRHVVLGSQSRFLLSTAPRPWQISGEASPTAEARQPCGIAQGEHFRSRRPFEILAQFAREEQIPFLDCSVAFQYDLQPETLFLQTSPGLSERGHDVYAAQLAEAVLQLIPGFRATSSPWQGVTQ